MVDYKEYFKDKRITIMGLGLLGRGLGYTKFLADQGAILTVTDLKSKKQLATSIKELKKYNLPAGRHGNIKYVLGKHRLEDFKNKDMVIKSAGVPLDSIYIKEARKNKIPIEMDVSLFAKLAPEVMLIGVTGTRGKSMTTVLIYEILKQNEKLLKKKVYLGGNVRGVATLPLLEKVKTHAKAGQAGDILVCELDSWQLQGFGPTSLKLRGVKNTGMSPNISVFTSFMPDHMNYYGNNMKDYFADKANIFKYQKKNDVLVVRPHVRKLIKNTKSKLIVADVKNIKSYKFIVPGVHQRENLACAVAVARLFPIPESKIRAVVKKFKGLEGRLQYLKTVRGVKIYNDNNATTPEATISGIRALVEEDRSLPASRQGKIILISGGNDKGLDLKLFINVVNTFCKALILIPGSGTNKLLKPARLNSRSSGNFKIKIPNEKTKDVKSAVIKALKHSKKGDIILFSPSFSSFSQFNNEYERGDLFVKIVKKLR